MERIREILKRLLINYERRRRLDSGDEFKTLISIILSRNNSYRNERTAFSRLKEMTGVVPEKLAKAPISLITLACSMTNLLE